MNKSYKALYRYLFPFIMQHRFRLGVVIIALICVSLALMAFGHILNQLIDAVNDGEDNGMYFTELFVLTLFFSLVSFTRAYNINYIATHVVYSVKIALYEHLMSVPPYAQELYTAEDIHCRLTSDLDKLYKLIVDIFSFLLRNSIMLCGSIVLMFIENAKLTFITFIGIGILLFVVSRLSKKTRILAGRLQSNEMKLATQILEGLRNFKILYALKLSGQYLLQQQKHVQGYLVQATERYQYRALFFASAMSGILLLILGVCYVGVNDIGSGQLSSGSMIAFLFFAIMAAFSLGGIVENTTELETNVLAISRALELVRLSANANNIDGELEQFSAASNINITDLSFAYPGRPEIDVLKGCTLSIPCKGLSAIVGPSGSGKSSILQLLMAFYQQQKGAILLDDKELSPEERKGLFAYCPQDPMLFSLSIKENICLGRKFDSERFQVVAEITGLDSVIDALPQGEGTNLSSLGSDLSGGQRQRIAIARALYGKSAPILILDEATSSLDSESERKIMHAISTGGFYQAVICITHKLANIKDADQIFLLHKGKVEVCGKHKDLLKESKLYQLLNYEL